MKHLLRGQPCVWESGFLKGDQRRLFIRSGGYVRVKQHCFPWCSLRDCSTGIHSLILSLLDHCSPEVEPSPCLWSFRVTSDHLRPAQVLKVDVFWPFGLLVYCSCLPAIFRKAGRRRNLDIHDIISWKRTDGHLGLITECFCCGGGLCRERERERESHLNCGKDMERRWVTRRLVTLCFRKPHDAMLMLIISSTPSFYSSRTLDIKHLSRFFFQVELHSHPQSTALIQPKRSPNFFLVFPGCQKVPARVLWLSKKYLLFLSS